MKSRLFAFSMLGAFLAVEANASAHAVLINPPPLTNDDNAKSGPCGCYFGAGPEDPTEDPSPTACPASFKVTDLVAGSQIQVTWKETVLHTGKFMVAFSDKQIDTVTKAEMEAGTIYNQTDNNNVQGGLVSTTITVPNKPCQNCVIQFRQLMDAASTPYYYSCAAVNVTMPSGSSSSGGTGSSSSGGTGGTGGMGGTGGANGEGGDYSIIAGPAPIDQTQASGYCSMRQTGAPRGTELGFVALALGSIALRRKSAR